MLSLTQEQFSKLKPLILSPEIVNAESDMYLYKGNYKDEKVLKIYLEKDLSTFHQKSILVIC